MCNPQLMKSRQLVHQMIGNIILANTQGDYDKADHYLECARRFVEEWDDLHNQISGRILLLELENQIHETRHHVEVTG